MPTPQKAMTRNKWKNFWLADSKACPSEVWMITFTALIPSTLTRVAELQDFVSRNSSAPLDISSIHPSSDTNPLITHIGWWYYIHPCLAQPLVTAIMTDAERSKKPVSERRRQQNLRAQKAYRERQKRHVKALEDLLASPQSLRNDPGDETSPQHLCSPLSEPISRSSHSSSAQTVNASPVSSRADPLSDATALGYINNFVGSVDEDTAAKIRSGEVTMADILRAGLSALRLAGSASQAHETEAGHQADEASPLRLCNRKIIIPQNNMMVHTDTLPDIYSNHLRIKQFSLVAALRANAEHLGISFQALADEEGESPFYSSSCTDNGLLNNTALQLTRFQNIKPHLRPIAAQIEIPHHPYIDVVPCPIFRQRILQLTAMSPPMVDEVELCGDFEKDGLVCWGSYMGGHEATGSGAPWDIRSWEAQPWFLKKWWFLLGGDEGAFFEQTRWWHEVRGDTLPSLF